VPTFTGRARLRNNYLELSRSNDTAYGVAPADTARILYDRSLQAIMASIEGEPYLPLGAAPGAGCDFFADFVEAPVVETFTASLTLTSGNADINKTPVTNTEVATAYFVIPRGGVVTAVSFIGEDGLAANDTNFLTFRLTNLAAAAGGSGAVILATDVNTTKVTGGSATTAQVARTLSVATDEAANVAAGDVLKFTATATQSPGAIDSPRVTIQITQIPEGLTPVYERTVGAPLVRPVANTQGGEAILQLNATNEVNAAGISFGDRTTIGAGTGPVFTARVKVGTVTTAQTVIIGLASAYNATLDNIVLNAWFRLVASLAVVVEADDGTTDTDDQATSPATTLTAGTYYTFKVDLSAETSAKFYIDGTLVGAIAVAALPVHATLMQPIIAIQKASGTGTVAVTVDYVRVQWDRS
jgi:hypothetical protein